MTTYSFSLTLNDTETIMLQEALKLMIEKCDENIANGDTACTDAYKSSAQEVLKRLHDNPTQTSGNSFTNFEVKLR